MPKKEKEKLLTAEIELNDVDILRNDEDMAIVSLDILHLGENRNNCDISEECVNLSLDTIPNKPITFRYNRQMLETANDIAEHAHNEQQLFETRVAGHVPTNARMKLAERPNGKTYLNVEGVIQKRYVPKLMEIFANNDGKLKVSVEFLAQGTQDKDTGIFHITKFKLQAITLLSNSILEGMEGSKALLDGFTDEEVNEMNNRYFSFAFSRQEEPNIFEQIKNAQKEATVKVEALTTRQLEQKLWDKLKDFTYSDGNWTGKRYWIVDTDTENRFVYIHDNMTDVDYKAPYSINEDNEVKIDMDEKVEVKHETQWKEKAVKNAFIFTKEDWGKGAKIEIDKSKEAMSNKVWGDVDKTDLRNKVMEAENYEELAHAVYLVVEEGWEEAPSERLKYPVMQIVGGKAVYNRYGLASALAYAEAENEEEVVKKVKELYKELGIETEEKKNADENLVKEETTGKTAEEEHKEELADEVKERLEEITQELAELKEEHDKLKAEKENLIAEMQRLLAEKEELNAKATEAENACKEITARCKTAENELKKFKLAETKAEKCKYAETYATAFTANEYEVIAAKVDDDDMCYEDFCKFVDGKLTEKMKAQVACGTAKKEKTMAQMFRYDTDNSKSTKRTLDDVIASLD